MLEEIFGTGDSLATHQMAARAFVLFFLTLVMIRIAGMRAFGHKSAFDALLTIMLGAVLSRAVTGASPFWPIVAAGFVLVVLHRAIAHVTACWPRLEHVVKGRERLLYRDGVAVEPALRRTGISREDLIEAVRRETNRSSLDDVREIYIETSGKLSVITAPPA